MSGHSKWSTIKHKKAAVDAKRGKVFTRLAKEITIAARESGGDTAMNTRLRLGIEKAKAANMPKDNIERAVKRGTGELDGGELIEMFYEGYGPHGVAILIEVVTDNKNRAVGEVRHCLNKNGGSMADAGSVSWQFNRKGYFEIKEVGDQDELFMTAADAGADDVQFSETAEVYCPPESFTTVRDSLEEAGYKLDDASSIYEAANTITLAAAEATQVMRLIEALEDLDDVQNVYSSLELTDEVLAAMEAE